MRVLLMEDNPADAGLLREALEAAELPHELVWVRNGNDARARLRREGEHAGDEAPDLAVLDLNVPHAVNGEIIDLFRQCEHLRDVPVLLLSGSQSPMDMFLASELRHGHYIIKPQSFDEWLAIGPEIRRFYEEANVVRARS